LKKSRIVASKKYIIKSAFKSRDSKKSYVDATTPHTHTHNAPAHTYTSGLQMADAFPTKKKREEKGKRKTAL